MTIYDIIIFVILWPRRSEIFLTYTINSYEHADGEFKRAIWTAISLQISLRFKLRFRLRLYFAMRFEFRIKNISFTELSNCGLIWFIECYDFISHFLTRKREIQKKLIKEIACLNRPFLIKAFSVTLCYIKQKIFCPTKKVAKTPPDVLSIRIKNLYFALN